MKFLIFSPSSPVEFKKFLFWFSNDGYLAADRVLVLGHKRENLFKAFDSRMLEMGFDSRVVFNDLSNLDIKKLLLDREYFYAVTRSVFDQIQTSSSIFLAGHFSNDVGRLLLQAKPKDRVCLEIFDGFENLYSRLIVVDRLWNKLELHPVVVSDTLQIGKHISFEWLRPSNDYIASSLAGKSVCIVGPANHDTRIDLSVFDIVVRLNSFRPTLKGIGYDDGRCDVIGHTLQERDGEYSLPTLRDLNLCSGAICISSLPLYEQEENTILSGCRGNRVEIYNYFKFYRFPLYLPSKISYENLCSYVGSGVRPTTGLSTIWTLLQMPIKSLMVSKMTFCLTGYSPGYFDRHGSEDENGRRINGYVDNHSPKAELIAFKKIERQYKGLVKTDSVLADLLEQEA